MEINYGELFGLDEGVKEHETAEPAGEVTETGDGTNGDEGAKEQETAEPAGEENTQSEEDNARFAAARRKAERERDAAIAQAQAEAKKTVDETIAGLGMTNPYTDEPIKTREQYEAYRAQYEKEKRARILEKTGMSDDEFKQYVDAMPEVREAKRAAEGARRERAELHASEQLKEIAALDPSIKTLEDLTRMPDYPAFYERVKRGMTLAEAFKLTNYDKLTKGAAAASRQAALNAVNGKGHMAATSARGTGAVSVPPEVMEQYKALNPDATEAEIQAHYNRSHRKQ